jgi:glucosamine-6-phosphate deaminase
MTHIPEYLRVTARELGRGTPVHVRRVPDMAALAVDMARAMIDLYRQAHSEGRPLTLMVPVGPLDQFPVLAERINQDELDWRQVVVINLNEYLTDDGRWIDLDHPLSLRGYMERRFYGRIDPQRAPLPENRVFPDPKRPQAVAELIASRGGVDACFAGIGINGNVGFNEPPGLAESPTNEEFADRPTRSLALSPETRTIHSVIVGGELSVIPRLAITVGMREILASRRLRFYCNRPWQRGVVRRVLHGPIGPACPASYLRTHADAELTLADFVAEPPDIQLR